MKAIEGREGGEEEREGERGRENIMKLINPALGLDRWLCGYEHLWAHRHWESSRSPPSERPVPLITEASLNQTVVALTFYLNTQEAEGTGSL